MIRKVWHIVTFLGGLLLVTVGCKDNSYTGAYDPTLLPKDPIAFVIRIGEETKAYGNGVVSDMLDLKDASVYVSAVKSVDAPSMLDENTFLIDNRRATVNVEDAKLDWLGEDGPSPVYYPLRDSDNDGYEVFVWYRDNASVVKEDRLADRSRLHLIIDGTQDIMSGKCSASAESISHEKLYSFSYYTAIRDIVPVFTPQHLLTCLTIQFRQSLSNMRQEIVVRSVQVKAYDHIIMTTAARDDSWMIIEPEGDKTLMGSYIIDDSDPLIVPSVEKAEDQKIRIAGSILMPSTADDKIVVYVDADQRIYQTDTDHYDRSFPFHSEIELETPGGLLTGHHYVATLTLSGTIFMGEKIELVDWDYGGYIEVDEDKKPEFN